MTSDPPKEEDLGPNELICDSDNAIIMGKGWRASYYDPHERWKVLTRYSDMLTGEQRDTINNAPTDAVIRIETEGGKVTSVMAITSKMMEEMREMTRK